jgi:hypothetical protein
LLGNGSDISDGEEAGSGEDGDTAGGDAGEEGSGHTGGIDEELVDGGHLGAAAIGGGVGGQALSESVDGSDKNGGDGGSGGGSVGSGDVVAGLAYSPRLAFPPAPRNGSALGPSGCYIFDRHSVCETTARGSGREAEQRDTEGRDGPAGACGNASAVELDVLTSLNESSLPVSATAVSHPSRLRIIIQSTLEYEAESPLTSLCR